MPLKSLGILDCTFPKTYNLHITIIGFAFGGGGTSITPIAPQSQTGIAAVAPQPQLGLTATAQQPQTGFSFGDTAPQTPSGAAPTPTSGVKLNFGATPSSSIGTGSFIVA